MSGKRSAAQKRAIAASYAAKAVTGRGAYHAGSYHRSRAVAAYKPRVKGRGDYKKDYGSRLGSVIGEGLQELLTQLGGIGGIGRAVGGFGDYVKPKYQVKENSLLSMGNDPPEVINSPMGNVIVRHREYLQDVVTGGAGVFNITQYPIQPGNSTTFPWLHNIAQSFEQYRLRGMIFEFKSTSADALNSSNTALGTVIMATEYDSLKPGFTSKLQMENHQYAASARQSCSMLHPIECAAHQSTLDNLYVRDPAVDPEGDIRMYDFGNFYIATTGQQGSSVNIGELWCTYEIELIKPQLDLTPSDPVSGAWLGTGTVSAAYPFGTTKEENENNTISVLFDQDVYPTGSIQFDESVPAGSYLMLYHWEDNSSGVVNVPTWASVDVTTTTGVSSGSGTGSSYPAYPFPAGLSWQAPTGGETATRVTQAVWFDLTAHQDGHLRGLYILSTATMVSPEKVAIFITQVSRDMLGTMVPYVAPSVAQEELQAITLSSMTRKELLEMLAKIKEEEEKEEKEKVEEKPTPKVEECIPKSQVEVIINEALNKARSKRN